VRALFGTCQHCGYSPDAGSRSLLATQPGPNSAIADIRPERHQFHSETLPRAGRADFAIG